MTSKLVTLTMVAQLVASVALVPAAWAQSSGTDNSGGTSGTDNSGTDNSGTDNSGSGTSTDGTSTSGTADPNDETSAGDNEAQFGNDWSASLGSAIFSDNTMTTVRSADEISTQWTTLSAEDREILRRDCTAFRTDAAAGTSGAAAGGTADTTAGAASAMRVGGEQMTVICTTVDTLQ